MSHNITIEELWQLKKFHPNDAQRKAILHVDFTMYMPV